MILVAGIKPAVSAANKAAWADPERRAKRVAALKAAAAASWADPEVRARRCAAIKAALACPELRARMTAEIRAAMARPEVRARMNAAKRLPDLTPEQRRVYAKIRKELGRAEALAEALRSPESRLRNRVQSLDQEPIKKMKEVALQDRPALPGGTYHLTALAIGGDRMRGATTKFMCPTAFAPAKLGVYVQRCAAEMVPEGMPGAQPGMWWLFHINVYDVWGRHALVWDQAPIDCTLTQEELAGELARVGPESFVTVAEQLMAIFARPPQGSAAAAWPSTVARH